METSNVHYDNKYKISSYSLEYRKNYYQDKKNDLIKYQKEYNTTNRK